MLQAKGVGRVTSRHRESDRNHLDRARRSDDEITVFSSVGIGLQDLVTARILVDCALRNGTGTVLDLSA
nr:hypothetical protein [Nocardia sp. 348MFTsu5.1]